MTTIATVSVTDPGIKGFCGSADLGPVTLIVGPNKAGKTSLMDTIRGGVVGISSRPSGYATKSSEVRPPTVTVDGQPDVMITMELSSGARFERLISTSRTETKRADDLADEMIGRPLISAAILMGATAGQARAAMAACLTRGGLVAGWTVQEAAERVELAMLAELDNTDDGTTRAAWLEPLVTMRGKYPRAPVTGAEDDGGAWMTALIPAVEEDLKVVRTPDKDRHGKAWKSAQKAKPTPPPQDLAKAKADRQRASAAIADATATAERAARYQQSLATWTAERDRLQGLADRITADGVARKEALAALRTSALPDVPPSMLAEVEAAEAAPVPQPEPVDASYHQTVADAQSALDAPVPGPDAAEVARLTTEIAAAEAELSRLTTAHEAEKVKLAQLRNAVESAAAIAVQAAADYDGGADVLRQHRADLAALVNLHADGQCKTCHDPDPYDLAGRQAKARADIATCEAAVSELYAAMTGAKQAATTASTNAAQQAQALSDAEAQHYRQADRLTDMRATLARLTDPAAEERIRSSQRAALAAAQTRLADAEEFARRETIRRERARLERITAADSAITARREQLAAARASQVAAAEADLALLRQTLQRARDDLARHGEPPVQPDASAVDVAALQAEIVRCEAIEAAWTLYDKALVDYRAAEVAAQSAQVRWSAATCLLRCLRLCVADLAATAVDPIQAAMDAVIADLPPGIGSRPYYLAADDFGVILPSGVPVKLQNASGAERLVGEAVIDVALASLQGCPVSIAYIDEIARVQDDHLRGLVTALVRAVERGAVSQVIATMPVADDPALAESRLSLVCDIHGVTLLDVRTVLARPSC